MGDSITEGDVAEILKQVGDPVDADEIIAIIETDKVNVDIRSPVTGTIASISANQGDTVAVGGDFMTITLSEGAAPPQPEAQALAPEPKAEAFAESGRESKAESSPKASLALTESDQNQRLPSIKFRYGKRDPDNVTLASDSLGVKASASGSGSGSSQAQLKPGEKINYVGVPPQYRRKPLSDRAIQLIDLGGASE